MLLILQNAWKSWAGKDKIKAKEIVDPNTSVFLSSSLLRSTNGYQPFGPTAVLSKLLLQQRISKQVEIEKSCKDNVTTNVMRRNKSR
jgi:hypothetical protein